MATSFFHWTPQAYKNQFLCILGETISTGTTLVTWYDGKTSGPRKEDDTLDLDGDDFSLIFKEPEISDTGRYICRVSNYNGYLIHNQTELRVLGKCKLC